MRLRARARTESASAARDQTIYRSTHSTILFALCLSLSLTLLSLYLVGGTFFSLILSLPFLIPNEAHIFVVLSIYRDGRSVPHAHEFNCVAVSTLYGFSKTGKHTFSLRCMRSAPHSARDATYDSAGYLVWREKKKRYHRCRQQHKIKRDERRLLCR